MGYPEQTFENSCHGAGWISNLSLDNISQIWHPLVLYPGRSYLQYVLAVCKFGGEAWEIGHVLLYLVDRW